MPTRQVCGQAIVRWIEEMQSAGLMRNEGEEDVQGGAFFLAGWKK